MAQRIFWIAVYRFLKGRHPWLRSVVEHKIPELSGLVRSRMQDQDAILSTLTLPWSNGRVEGQVNRLKLIKRQMYGRARFDPLRVRVLAHSP